MDDEQVDVPTEDGAMPERSDLSKDREIEVLRAENSRLKERSTTMFVAVVGFIVFVALAVGVGGWSTVQVGAATDNLKGTVDRDLVPAVGDMVPAVADLTVAVASLKAQTAELERMQLLVRAGQEEARIRGLKLRAVGCRNLLAAGETFTDPDDVCLEDEVLEFYDPGPEGVAAGASP